jgi:hypothetical protein
LKTEYARRFFLFSSILLVPLSAQQYTFERFSIAGQPTYATAINNSGAIVGITNEQFQPPYGFVRHANGQLQFPIRVFDSTLLTGIANHGEIVGWYSFTTQGLSSIRGFTFGNGNWRVIDVSNGFFPRTKLAGINAKGDLVGVADAGDGGNDGFLLSKGTVTWLTLPGGDAVAPHGIASDGTIVGCSYLTGNATAPLVRGPKGNYLGLAITGAQTACANGINNAFGKIVGSYAKTLNGPSHGFIYDYVTDLTQSEPVNGLPVRTIPIQVIDYPGAQSTVINGINAQGVIVGWAKGMDGADFAFIGTPEGASGAAGAVSGSEE